MGFWVLSLQGSRLQQINLCTGNYVDTALVLDHGSHIFIWLGTAHAGGAAAGSETQGNGWTRDVVEAAAQGFVAGLADGRFPVPEVRVAFEVFPPPIPSESP